MGPLKLNSLRLPQAPRAPERADFSIAVPKGEIGPGSARRLPADGFDRAQVGPRRRVGGSTFEPAPTNFNPQTAPLSPKAEPFRQGVIDLAKAVATNPKLTTQPEIDRALLKGLKKLKPPADTFGELLKFGQQTTELFKVSGASGQRDNQSLFKQIQPTLDSRVGSIVDQIKLNPELGKGGALRKLVSEDLAKALPDVDVKSRLFKQALRYTTGAVKDAMGISGASSDRWSNKAPVLF